MYACKVVADSIAHGVRLTTLEVTFPRYILAEFNTHRVFSRNSASSRAIPVKTRVKQILENPFVPEFTKNKAGMSADAVLDGGAADYAEELWRKAATYAAHTAEEMANLEVHKQQANRILETYAMHTVIVTATYWQNFWNLRIHVSASPEMYRTAQMMKSAMDASTPVELQQGQWHLPYTDGGDCCELNGYNPMSHSDMCDGALTLAKISVARCAAVSYERQYVEKTVEDYVKSHDRHKGNGHWSPFEHQAKVATPLEMLQHAYFKWDSNKNAFEAVCIGNFQVPWLQYRKQIPGEDVFQG